MKIRKHNKITSYSKEELNKISDFTNSKEYKYNCFRKYVWDNIHSAASNGSYYISINVDKYDDDFINEITKELMSKNITCNSYTLTNNQYMGPNWIGITGGKIIKTLEVCWNSFKYSSAHY